jgi:hypothetical protein
MISTLGIKNFKSIASLQLDCRRVNVLIGRPNVGKSNILESLGLLSFGFYQSPDDDSRRFVRFESTTNLFRDDNLEEPFELSWDDTSLLFEYENGRFEGHIREAGNTPGAFSGDHGDIYPTSPKRDHLAPFKIYRFRDMDRFDNRKSEFLKPPSGDNLLSLLLTHKELRSLANDLFSTIGLRLGLRPQEHRMEILKEFEDIIVSYPYQLSSDTLRRIIFYMAAILSNKDSVLIFEEPESHAFPYYTKYLAELIALDQRQNQYFMSTHNPYFLLPLLEKCPKDEVAVFITYYEDYETKVRPLTDAQIEELTEVDIFSNLESFLED